MPVLIALVGIWIFFSVQSNVFLSSRNLSNLALQIVVMSVIGLALVLVLLVGEIDLSVAYLSAVCAAVAATLSVRLGWPFALALAGGMGAGALWGLGQGLVTTRFRVPSFIVTLGASLILTGILQKLLPSDTYEIGLVNDPIALIANAFLPSWLSFAGVAAAVVVVGMLKLQTYRQRRQHGFKSSLIGTVLAPVAAVAIAGAVLVDSVRRLSRRAGRGSGVARLAGRVRLPDHARRNSGSISTQSGATPKPRVVRAFRSIASRLSRSCSPARSPPRAGSSRHHACWACRHCRRIR